MTREEFLQLADSYWPELESLQANGDFYAYEKRFAEIMKGLELSVLQAHLGKAPTNYRKKSPLPPPLDQ